MRTITYNSKTNKLTIVSDGKPVAGLCGPDSKRRFEKLVKAEIARLENNSDALQKWLFQTQNTGDPNWPKNKSEYDALQIRIHNLREKLNPSTKGVENGVVTASINSNLFQ